MSFVRSTASFHSRRKYPSSRDCVFAEIIGTNVTAFDLAADRRIPAVAAAEFALVKPHLDACGAQRIAQVLGGLGVLGSVAQKYGPAWVDHGSLVMRGRRLGFSGVRQSAM
jgi:hypothetical protein